MKEKEKKKTALNDWGTLIADFNALPKIIKRFFIVCAVFLFFFAIFATPDMPSETDRMRNRIAYLQDDIKSQTQTLGMVGYSAEKSAKEARRALAEGITNPLGPTEDNREDYQDGVRDVNAGEEISREIITKIASDRAEIEKIQQNLAAGVYKEK